MNRRYVSFYEFDPNDGRLWAGPGTNAGKTIGVVSEKCSPQWSGLYDAHGNKLIRVYDPEPIGFVHFKRVLK